MGEGFTENFLFLRLGWKLNYITINMEPKIFSEFDDHSRLIEALNREMALSVHALFLDSSLGNFIWPERLNKKNK